MDRLSRISSPLCEPHTVVAYIAHQLCKKDCIVGASHRGSLELVVIIKDGYYHDIIKFINSFEYDYIVKECDDNFHRIVFL